MTLGSDSPAGVERDIAELYRQMRSAREEDFELLASEFNRRCTADPESVMRALAAGEFKI